MPREPAWAPLLGANVTIVCWGAAPTCVNGAVEVDAAQRVLLRYFEDNSSVTAAFVDRVVAELVM